MHSLLPRLYFVHRIEDVLVHHMDVEMILPADGSERVDGVGKSLGARLEVHQHDHTEELGQHALCDVYNVDLFLSEIGTDFGDDADRILADHGDNLSLIHI